MSFLFFCYFFTLMLVAWGMKNAAYVVFGASTVLSIVMFAYHTTSSLDLNF